MRTTVLGTIISTTVCSTGQGRAGKAGQGTTGHEAAGQDMIDRTARTQPGRAHLGLSSGARKPRNQRRRAADCPERDHGMFP